MNLVALAMDENQDRATRFQTLMAAGALGWAVSLRLLDRRAP